MTLLPTRSSTHPMADFSRWPGDAVCSALGFRIRVSAAARCSTPRRGPRRSELPVRHSRLLRGNGSERARLQPGRPACGGWHRGRAPDLGSRSAERSLRPRGSRRSCSDWPSARWLAARDPVRLQQPGARRCRGPRRGEGERVTRLRTEAEVRTVAFSPDGGLLASGQVDGTAIMWRPAAGNRSRPCWRSIAGS